MATNKRRRERYALDEEYRERKLRARAELREKEKADRIAAKRLRGWHPIHSVPENFVVMIYDPQIFWPVVATLEDGHWRCLHYSGPQPRPTHWRHILEVPLDPAGPIARTD